VSDDEEDHDCVSDTYYHGISAVYVRPGWHEAKDIVIVMAELDVPWSRDFGWSGMYFIVLVRFSMMGVLGVVVMLVI